jgi:hypothetical protein
LGRSRRGLEVFVSQISLPQDGIGRSRRRGNNRATVRYRCAPATIGKLYLNEDHEFQHAWVVNLSRTGIGFLLARPLPSGTAVLIHMRGNEDSTMHEMPAQVVHCTVQLQGEWMVGCVFDDLLSPELLDNLL